MKANSKSVLSLAFAGAILCSMSGAHGATPVYQWNFDSADGANTGTGTGGTLALDVGVVTGANGYASGTFAGTGVSGNAGDNAFNASNAYDNYYANNSYSPITNAAAVSNIDLTGLSQFTITMWVNRNGQRNVDLLNIGSTTTPGTTSNPGISIGLDGNWGNGVRVGVNGYAGWTGDLWGAGYNTDWVFLAFAYNGNNGAYWGQGDMNTLYGGGDNNAAIITGDTSTSASVAQNLGIHDGGYWNSAGLPSVGNTATMFLANDGSNTLGTTNGFDGQLDDIRIYNSLLTVSEIETVRLSAIPEPSAAALGAMGALALLRRRRF